jgi:hypothetical protein
VLHAISRKQHPLNTHAMRVVIGACARTRAPVHQSATRSKVANAAGFQRDDAASRCALGRSRFPARRSRRAAATWASRGALDAFATFSRGPRRPPATQLVEGFRSIWVPSPLSYDWAMTAVGGPPRATALRRGSGRATKTAPAGFSGPLASMSSGGDGPRGSRTLRDMIARAPIARGALASPNPSSCRPLTPLVIFAALVPLGGCAGLGADESDVTRLGVGDPCVVADEAEATFCRCDGPDPSGSYCDCPSGMRCEELVAIRAGAVSDPHAGSYCVY